MPTRNLLHGFYKPLCRVVPLDKSIACEGYKKGERENELSQNTPMHVGGGRKRTRSFEGVAEAFGNTIKGETMVVGLDIDPKRYTDIMDHLYLRGKITDDSTAEEAVRAFSEFMAPAAETVWRGTPTTSRRFERALSNGQRIRFLYPRTPRIPHSTEAEHKARVVLKIGQMYKAIVKVLPTELRKVYAEQVEAVLQQINVEESLL